MSGLHVAISATMINRFVQHIQECCNTIVKEHPDLVYSIVDPDVSCMIAQLIPTHRSSLLTTDKHIYPCQITLQQLL